ncbi:MAG: beta-N-acetylhexosaminidase, partial [Confluentibacter sp.]|nr:beta-N-acetylhexosaminidase [Confluentibacter sp.]
MKKIIQILLLFLIVVSSSCSKSKVFAESDIAIIPKPVHLKLEKGVFGFNDKTEFVISDVSQKEAVSILLNKFKKAAGWTLQVSENAPKNN